ncbi:SAM-dependent methyltransferase [Phenylobacterium haematophilum]|uniref:SAM-dependent methyltransferase n=1 Tax=Phenylobacterium haematophilum TaxID=98513 RepID=A0A840A6Q3_9CAUL|nr:methyltransferase [Phenylobacterium haematophilum]MBB3893260.1 SAM-dependent methyltransferase [Phenylobacterium haematophilum]
MNDARPITPETIMQLGWGFWGSKTLLSAVELGVFTELSKGPLDLEALTSRLALHPRSARDFFDALVALGMLARDGRVYANTPESTLFLDKAKPTYIGGILEMANKRLYRFWDGLTEALRTGLPQNEAKDGGEDLFGVIYADPVILESFLRGMTGVSLPAAQAMAALFPWNEVTSFVDVGCAQGGATVAIAQAHPHLEAVGFDLAVVQPVFEAYVKEKALSDRVRFAAGDFFAGPLPSADVIIMGHILHDWDLEQKRMLLAKAYAALPEGGRLIVYDAIIDDERRQNAFGLLMSLNMLIETNGGFDYTGADCIGWMKEAGFRETRVQPLAGPDSMVIGTK